MGHLRLEHNAALDMARKLLAIIAPCLRPEEQKDCFEEFHRVCLQELRKFSMDRDRMLDRLNPGRN